MIAQRKTPMTAVTQAPANKKTSFVSHYKQSTTERIPVSKNPASVRNKAGPSASMEVLSKSIENSKERRWQI